MRDVAVVATAQSPAIRKEERRNEVEILMPVVHELRRRAGLSQADIGFTVSGSCDYLQGQAFAFVTALDAIGPWPPIDESHVEMDGAWALYEAWMRLQYGDIDTALVYSFGKSSPGDIRRVLSLQLDPYYLNPLWPDPVALAALQARAVLESDGIGERDLAEVVARARRNAKGNPNAQLQGDVDVDALLAEPMYLSPLRKHDCPPITDGAAAVILAAGDRAREIADRPAWIRGIDHRIEPHSLGVRNLADSPSTRTAGERAGVADRKVDVAELHAPFSHQEIILKRALGLSDAVSVNPSGGALGSNPVMVAGLLRIIEAAQRIMDGQADRAVAHATSGPALQQNLVAVLEGEGG
ncbi:MAG: thiolase domain-containing protein [Acidimicrobiia bacterium]|nr:thiolase domain-containing protein [Acidimicrobiia bacterium]